MRKILLVLVSLALPLTNAFALPAKDSCVASLQDLERDFSSSADKALPGEILACAKGEALSASEVDSLARSAEYRGPSLTRSLTAYRIVYATRRGTPSTPPAYSEAVILVPETQRAARVPAIVIAHGTMGLGADCRLSQEGERQAGSYLAELGYPLAANGYVVILPDYAGYSSTLAAVKPISGYHTSRDETFSVMDAARALRSFKPGAFSRDLVLVGHSQGGHAALSSLALADDTQPISAVVALAPSWFPMASFGGLIAVSPFYDTVKDADTIAASVWYHYAHAELFEGDGLRPFKAEKAALVEDFVRNQCDHDAVKALGDHLTDIFDKSFGLEVAGAAAFNAPCLTDRCRRWMKYYADDRPHIPAARAQTPVLYIHGEDDVWIPPERAQCGVDRLHQDGVNVTSCFVPDAKHDEAVGQRGDYAARWIAWKFLGEPEPGACGDTVLIPKGANKPATCAALPPNNR